jgi:hypothetical protein
LGKTRTLETHVRPLRDDFVQHLLQGLFLGGFGGHQANSLAVRGGFQIQNLLQREEIVPHNRHTDERRDFVPVPLLHGRV